MAGIGAGAPRWVLIAGASVPGRSHDLTPILTEGGFANLSLIEAQPADETTIYYGPDSNDVTADVAALFGLPASKVQADSSVYGVQLYLSIDFTSGTKPEVAAPSARDAVAQTAEDQKCQAVSGCGEAAAFCVSARIGSRTLRIRRPESGIGP